MENNRGQRPINLRILSQPNLKPSAFSATNRHNRVFYFLKFHFSDVILWTKGLDMPIISQFYGIAIYMFWREHEPAHFHAKYGDDEIVVEIETGRVTGKMSPRALALVTEWRKLHLDELKKEWELVKSKKQLFPIKPLE